MKTVVVVGGGVSGLAAAEALAHRARGRGDALRVVVVEKDTKLGGKVGTRDVDGCVVELGPHGFLDKDPAVLQLIDRVGVRPRLLRANESAAERYVLRAGALRRIPSKPPAFLTSDILPLGAKLRVALEPFVPPRRDDVDESVFEFPVAGKSPQEVGSAITYYKRYALSAALGLDIDDDDDGAAATHRPQAKPAAKPLSPADQAREDLLRLVTANKLDPKKLGVRFFNDYGLDIKDADVETVRGFLSIVADEVAVDKAAG